MRRARVFVIVRIGSKAIESGYAGGQEDEAEVSLGEDGGTTSGCYHSSDKTMHIEEWIIQLAWIGSATCAVRVSKIGSRYAASSQTVLVFSVLILIWS